MPAPDFYRALRSPRPFRASDLKAQLQQTSEGRVTALASELAAYMGQFLPTTIRQKNTLADYRTNPYVLMTTSSTMNLEDPRDLANFLVNLKLYMGLETSFGKSLESVVLGTYPVDVSEEASRWHDAPEKIAEFAALDGLPREQRAAARNASVWREIDKTCIAGRRRHLLSIKSGPQTINDTQVEAMRSAIRDHHSGWLEQSQAAYDIDGIDIVIGLTYGTDKTTNNKENQILVKLTESGFDELDRARHPGVLTNDDGTIHVYRMIGIDFWSYVGNPSAPSESKFVFLEMLLALAKALKENQNHPDIESALNSRLDMLAEAIRGLKFPKESLPEWIRADFSATELTWLAAAMSVFYDSSATVDDDSLF